MHGITDKVKQNRLKLTKDVRLALQRELYKQSFFDFFKAAAQQVIKPGSVWEFNWHHEYLCKELQQHAERINRNEPREHHLIVNCPPSVTKSTIVSICFNAWVWACVNPNHIFIQLSHSDELAIEFASVAKDLIESNWYRELFPHISIRQDSTAKSNFKINGYSGQRFSLSMLGGITGHHGTYILIDDYLDAKNVSPAKLENAQNIWGLAVSNRLESPQVGLICLIGQRINDSDLYHFLLSKNTDDRFKHICLPMELSNDVRPQELKEYYKNGVLWHERFPAESFAGLTDSTRVWATQFMQSPKIAGGGIVKESWFDIVDSVPDTDFHMFIDSAFTKTKSNDPSAILIGGMKDNHVYIKSCTQHWLDFPELLRKIKELAITHKISRIYIEPKANGLSLITSLRHETLLSVIELPNPKDSKMARMNAVTPKLESKRVKLLKGAWNDAFLYELGTFPMSKNDDMCDCLSYCVSTLLSGQGKLSWYM